MFKLEPIVISISIREFVESIFLQGDLFFAKSLQNVMQEGIQIHKNWQNIQQEQDENYSSEIPLFYEYKTNDFLFQFTGRMDGLIIRKNQYYVEEIKSTVLPLESISESTFPVHWAQAKCYAFMYAHEKQKAKMNVIVTYYQKETGETRQFQKSYTYQSLLTFFHSLVQQYEKSILQEYQWQIHRNESIEKLTFPFSSYRKGQQDLIDSVQGATQNGDVLFAQAPTGIGKTMAVLFATLKSIPETGLSKVFYLTARTPTQRVAEKALQLLQQNGLQYRCITLAAKEKVCLMGLPHCIGDECPYAKGYYDRINDAINDLLEKQQYYSIEDVVLTAQKYSICAFEFSLDLSLKCDCIVCDYNYVFDPKVFLKRYFFGNTGNGKYAFLIDEAHNMVKRAQEMFSAEISQYQIQRVLQETKAFDDLQVTLHDFLGSFDLIQHRMEAEETENYYYSTHVPEDFCIEVEKTYDAMKTFLEEKQFKDVPYSLVVLFYDLKHFLKVHDLFDSHYSFIATKEKSGLRCKEFCMDPSSLMQNILQRSYTSVFFSATLSPIQYFVRMLGGGRESVQFRTDSPFPKENLHVVIENEISTKYKERPQSFEKIALYIRSIADAKIGNYFVFFPSYAYMNKVYETFQLIKGKTSCILQKPNMNEKERNEFLTSFSFPHGRSLIGFAVMGGIFGEGIDLVGDQLSGAIIVGVGLPSINLENMVLKKYFDENEESGFGFAFVYPGINRVLQAVGRVIRTEEDRGVVLLIDKRFDHPNYRKLLPEEWGYVPGIHNPNLYASLLKEFWKDI
jgi:DNA excision repair protein ERCC-2